MVVPQFLRLKCPVQHYSWGRPASDSIISGLLVDRDFGGRQCAELWVGAHPSAPALIAGDRLDFLIASRPLDLLGARVVEQFGPQLPFLFKVLSIAEPLSIQAHPDRQLAKKLHAEDPEHYPDTNHKPEIAVALSDVQLLVGFRPIGEIYRFLSEVPELARLVGPLGDYSLESRSAESASSLRRLYSTLLTSDRETISHSAEHLYKRLAQLEKRSREEDWIVHLSKRYPEGDVGIFSFFILNFLSLLPFQAVYIAPNIPHAYLSGELIECMASSDNVVRAGLTEKYRDSGALLEMVDFHGGACGNLTIESQPGADAPIKQYRCPASEFALDYLEGPLDRQQMESRSGAELVFCLSGPGELIGESQVQGISKGDAILIAGSGGDYCLSLMAGSRVFRVFVP